MLPKLCNVKTSLKKSILLMAFIWSQAIYLSAQYADDISIIKKHDNTELVGSIIDETDDKIVIVVQKDSEFVAIQKSSIKKTISVDDVSVIMHHDNTRSVGKIVRKSDEEILLSLQCVPDTIAILKPMIKKMVDGRGKILFAKGRYHRKNGWVNSVGMKVGNLIGAQPMQSVPAPLSSQFEYLGYMLVHPNIGLGGGVARKSLTTPQLGYEYYSHYEFTDLFAYAKLYLGQDRRRFYLDAKVGYGFVGKDEIVFGCAYCDDPLPLAQRFTSGHAIQPGLGLEFATKRLLRWGINWSVALNKTTFQEDIYPEDGRTPRDGVIDFSTEKKYLGGIFLGINFYL